MKTDFLAKCAVCGHRLGDFDNREDFAKFWSVASVCEVCGSQITADRLMLLEEVSKSLGEEVSKEEPGELTPGSSLPMKTLKEKWLAEALEELAFWAEVVLECIPPTMESRDTLALGDALDTAEEALKKVHGLKCVLTDGDEIFDSRIVYSPEELNELNHRAAEATDGNLYWTEERR